MSRLGLWSLTAATCAAIVFLGTPALAPARAASARAVSAQSIAIANQGASWARSIQSALRVERVVASGPVMIGAGALGIVLVALTAASTLLLRRTRPRARVAAVRVLARRGRPVAAIARRTGLAQDAVRDLLGGDPLPVSSGPRGRFFRRRPAAAPAADSSFAAALAESSFEATA